MQAVTRGRMAARLEPRMTEDGEQLCLVVQADHAEVVLTLQEAGALMTYLVQLSGKVRLS